MLVDGSTIPDQTTLEADICIVGAGVCGLALAAELSSRSVRVVVVESGSIASLPTTQQLNDAAVDGDPSTGLMASRHRQVAGTARLWNTRIRGSLFAKFVPLDAFDFRGEKGRPEWPIRCSDIEPYFPKAHQLAGLGRFDYSPSSWDLPRSPLPDEHSIVESRLYHMASQSRFCEDLPRLVKDAQDVTLCTGATVIGLRWKGQDLSGVDAVAVSGARLEVRARWFVLAGGGVENARMLLLQVRAGTLRDQSGWLGRGFMEHPRDRTMVLSASSVQLSRKLEFFDTKFRNGSIVCGRVALREETIAKHDLLNASVSVLPAGPHFQPLHWRIRAVADRLGWTTQWPPGYGWSNFPTAMRRFPGFQLLVNLEEFPHAENRLTLDTRTDSLGVPRVRLFRKWRSVDAARLERLRRLLRRSLTEIGLGPVQMGPATIPNPDSHHHLGATRMAEDPKNGVTDSYGKVFGASNLFVAGPSTFSTGGWANPTLTSIALAIRLADKLVPPGEESSFREP